MNIRKNLKIIIPIFLLLVIAAAISVYLLAFKPYAEPSTQTADMVSAEVVAAAKNFKFTEAELRETVITIAKERFGEDCFVIPLNADSPSLVEIEGTERYVYIYAADSLNNQENADDIKGLYHVDPVTGEIFDNGNGKMEKIIVESDLHEEEQ